MEPRRIIHIDMDAFFASVEQQRHPEWRGRPVIVGGRPENRGVVCTASYEARAWGIHSAQPAATARKLCPGGIFVEPDMETYAGISRRIRSIFLEYTPLVEPMSIDEAFLDVSETCASRGITAVRLAREVQREIYRETGLTASAGVSYNKFLAKVASGLKKPAGLSVITPESAGEFLKALPIEEFYGVGPALAAKFRRIGVRTGRELLAFDLANLKLRFGKAGEEFYHIVRGVDPRPVCPVWRRKSFGREVTLPADVSDAAKLSDILRGLCGEVSALLRERRLRARTVTVKVRYGDMDTVTRSRTADEPFDGEEELFAHGTALLRRTAAGIRPVRLIGVSASRVDGRRETVRLRQPELDFSPAAASGMGRSGVKIREK